MTPFITVIMPVLDRAQYLPATIESVLAQTFGDLELIIVDDGSQDDSPAVAERYARSDRRINVIKLQRNPHGVSGARASNIAIKMARGAYIARMDSDDISTPRRFEVSLALMRERGLDACGGQAIYIGEREGELWFPETHEGIASELHFRIALLHSTLLWPASLCRATPYDEGVAADDFELLTRLVPTARLGNSPEIFLHHRAHASQSSRVVNRKMAQDWSRIRFAYFFKCFPNARPVDFLSLDRISKKVAHASISDLLLAGHWLTRLSQVREQRARQRMAERWDEACARMAEQSPELEDLHAQVRARINAGAA